MADRPLTAKQQRFCEEYPIDLNATQAAIRAGYAANSVNAYRVIGCHNLMKVNVQVEIQRHMAERSERTQIKADDVVIELAKLAFSNIQDFLTVGKDGEVFLNNFEAIEREKLAAIESIKISTTKNNDDSREYTTTQFKLHSKLNALEQLGKHLGIFKESAPHPEREKARQALQADERRELSRIARTRTAELSNEN